MKKSIINLVRVPLRLISTGLFGEHHTLTHRCLVGAGVMVVGVNMAHASEFFAIGVIKLTVDGIGYLIHGIGAVPFIDLIHDISNKLSGKDDEPE